MLVSITLALLHVANIISLWFNDLKIAMWFSHLLELVLIKDLLSKRLKH